MAPVVLGLGQASAPPPEPVMVSSRVASATDGATIMPWATWRDLETASYPRDSQGRNNSANFRFAGLEIPRGATILSAVITVWGHGNRSGANASDFVTIGAEQVDNASSIATSPNNGYSDHFSRMTNVETTVNWAWQNYSNNQSFQSPDLSEVVQEIVDRAGWPDGTGGAIQFFTQNNPNPNSNWADEPGVQNVQTNNSVDYIPLLEITYIP